MAATSWVDEVSALSAVASASFVVVGGLWAFFRFRKEKPYIARANLELEADLLTHGDTDLIRIKCTASAIGQGKFIFGKHKASRSVSVYAMTTDLVQQPSVDWTDPVVVSVPFADDVNLEAGEVVEEVDLLWAGPRQDDTLAYRVVALVTGSDEVKRTLFKWMATVVVPVEAIPDGAAPAISA
jgi:hypothetical protein